MPQLRAVADPSVANPEIFAAVGSGTRPAGEHAHLVTGADRRAAGTAAALRMPGGAAVPQPREPCYDLLVDVLVHISDSGRLRSAVSLGDYARAAPSTSSPTGCAPRTRPGTGVAKPDGLDGTVGAIRAALLDGASPVGPSWPYELLALVLTAAAARPPLGALGWPDDDFAQRGARTAAVSAPPSCAARWSPTSPQCSTPSIASRGRRWRDAYVDAPMRARRARAFVATLVARSAALDALLARSVDRARRRSASVSCPHTRPEETTVPDRSIARPYRPLLYGPVAWFFDTRAACADARAGIPAAEYIDAGPVLTPTVQQRAQTLADRAERELLQVQADTAPMRERQAQLRARVEDLTGRVEEQRSALTGLPERLPDADLERRSAGESETPVEGVRTRRAREHEGRRRAVADRLGALRGDLAAALAELARLDEAVRGREERGAIRARRLHAYTLRRIASYEARLVRRHPAGHRLAGRLVVVRPAVPGWAQLPASDERSLTPIEAARP